MPDKIITPENQGNIKPNSGIPLIESLNIPKADFSDLEKLKINQNNSKLTKKEREELALQQQETEKANRLVSLTPNEIANDTIINSPYTNDTSNTQTIGYNPYDTYNKLEGVSFVAGENYAAVASENQSGLQQARNAIVGGVAVGALKALEAFAFIPNIITRDWEKNSFAEALGEGIENLHDAMPVYNDPDNPLSWDSSMFWGGVQGVIESGIQFVVPGGVISKGVGAVGNLIGRGMLKAAANTGKMAAAANRINQAAQSVRAYSAGLGTLGTNASNFIAGLPAGYIQNQLEGTIMGMEHYKARVQEFLDQGVPLEEAEKQAAAEADQIRLQNQWMLATDILQLNALFKSPIKKGVMSPWLNPKSLLALSTSEGIEEMIQSGIQGNIENQGNKYMNEVFKTRLKYDPSKGAGLEAIAKFATTDQAIFEGMMGFFGGGFQNVVTAIPNRIIDNRKYNSLGESIKGLEAKISVLSDSETDKLLKVDYQNQIEDLRNQQLLTMKGRIKSQREQIEENENLIANQTSELFERMAAYQVAYEEVGEAEAEFIKDNMFASLVHKNLKKGSIDNLIDTLNSVAEGDKKAAKLFDREITPEIQEQAKALATEASRMRDNWDFFGKERLSEHKWMTSENIRITTKGVQALSGKLDEVEKKINEEIAALDAVAHHTGKRKFGSLEQLENSEYIPEPFKDEERYQELKSIVANKETPPSTKDRTEFFNLEAKKVAHDKLESENKKAFEKEKERFTKNPERVELKDKIEKLSKLRDEATAELNYLKEIQYEALNDEIMSIIPMLKDNDPTKSEELTNTIEKLKNKISSRDRLSTEGKNKLADTLSQLVSAAAQIHEKKRLEELIALREKNIKDRTLMFDTVIENYNTDPSKLLTVKGKTNIFIIGIGDFEGEESAFFVRGDEEGIHPIALAELKKFFIEGGLELETFDPSELGNIDKDSYLTILEAYNIVERSDFKLVNFIPKKVKKKKVFSSNYEYGKIEGDPSTVAAKIVEPYLEALDQLKLKFSTKLNVIFPVENVIHDLQNEIEDFIKRSKTKDVSKSRKIKSILSSIENELVTLENTLNKIKKEALEPIEPIETNSYEFRIAYLARPYSESTDDSGIVVDPFVDLDAIPVHHLDLNPEEGGLKGELSINLIPVNTSTDSDNVLYGAIDVNFPDGTKAQMHTPAWNLRVAGIEDLTERDGNTYKFNPGAKYIEDVLLDDSISLKDKNKLISNYIQQGVTAGSSWAFVNHKRKDKESEYNYIARVVGYAIAEYVTRRNIIANGSGKGKIKEITKGILTEQETAYLPTSELLKDSRVKLSLVEVAVGNKAAAVTVPMRSNISGGRTESIKSYLTSNDITDEDIDTYVDLIINFTKGNVTKQGNSYQDPSDFIKILDILFNTITFKSSGGNFDLDVYKGTPQIKIRNSEGKYEVITGQDLDLRINNIREAVAKELAGKKKNIPAIANLYSGDEFFVFNKTATGYDLTEGNKTDWIINNTQTKVAFREVNGVRYYHEQASYIYKIEGASKKKTTDDTVSSLTPLQKEAVKPLKKLAENKKNFKSDSVFYTNDKGEKFVRVSYALKGGTTTNFKMKVGSIVGNYSDAIGRYYFEQLKKGLPVSFDEFLDGFLKSENSTKEPHNYEALVNIPTKKQLFQAFIEKFEKAYNDIIEKYPGAVIVSDEVFLIYEGQGIEVDVKDEKGNTTKHNKIGGTTDLILVDTNGNYHIIDMKTVTTNDGDYDATLDKNITERYGEQKSREQQWNDQQTLYAKMLAHETGKDVTIHAIALGYSVVRTPIADSIFNENTDISKNYSNVMPQAVKFLDLKLVEAFNGVHATKLEIGLKTTEAPITQTIEQQKADIEKRWQEELKDSKIIFEKLTSTVDGSWDAVKPINDSLINRFENSLLEGDKIITGNNETLYYRNNKIVKSNGKVFGMSNIPSVAILSNGATIDRTDKINAKYNAELDALNQQPSADTQETTSTENLKIDTDNVGDNTTEVKEAKKTKRNLSISIRPVLTREEEGVRLDEEEVTSQYNRSTVLINGRPIPAQIQDAIVDETYVEILYQILKENNKNVSKIKKDLLEYWKDQDDVPIYAAAAEQFEIIWELAKIKVEAIGIKIKENNKDGVVIKDAPENTSVPEDADEIGEQGGPSEKFDNQIFEIDDYDNIKPVIKETLALTPVRVPVEVDGEITYETKTTIIGTDKFYDVEDLIRELRQVFSGIPNLTWDEDIDKKNPNSVKGILTAYSEKAGKEHFAGLLNWMETKWKDPNVKNAFISSMKNYKNIFTVGLWNYEAGGLSFSVMDGMRDSGGGVLYQKWASNYFNPENGFISVQSDGTIKYTDKNREVYNAYRNMLLDVDPDSFNEKGINYNVTNKFKFAKMDPNKFDILVSGTTNLFNTIGIEVTEDQVRYMILNQKEVYKVGMNRELTYTPYGEKGLFDFIFREFEKIDTEKSSREKSPFSNARKSLRTLATYLSVDNGHLYSESARSKDGSMRFAYTIYGPATNIIAKIKRGDLKREDFGVFGKDSTLIHDNHLDYNIFTELSKKDKDDLDESSELTPLEMEIAKINMIHNQGNKIRYAPTATNSDKKPFPHLVFTSHSVDYNYSSSGINSQIVPFLKAVEAESERMKYMPSSTGDARVDQGTKFYFLIPEANISVAKEILMLDLNSSSEKLGTYLKLAGIPSFEGTNEQLIEMILNKNYSFEGDRAIMKFDDLSFTRYLMGLVYMKRLNTLKNRWERLGVFNSEEGDHKLDVNWISKRTHRDDTFEQIIDKAAREYLTISTEGLLGYYQIIVGDPVSSFKSGGTALINADKNYKSASDFTWQEVYRIVKATNTEVIKRNAKNLASGKLLNFNVYNPVTSEFEQQKEYKLTVIKDDIRDSKIKELIEKHPAAYKGMTVADAYEVVTAEEFLNVEWANNDNPELTETEYKEIMTKLHNQSKYEWDKPLKEKDKLSPSQLRIVYGAQKPVQVGTIDFVNDKESGVKVTGSFYGKSAAFPIIHQIHVGTELNKLAKAMHQKGIQRAIFESGVKNGAVNPTKVFNNGIIDDSVEVLSEKLYPINLSRNDFYIQNEIPFDESKSEILLVSQLDKLFTEHIETIAEDLRDVTDKDGNIIKKGIKTRKTEVRKAMFDRALQDLADQLGIIIDGDKAIIPDKSKVINKLRTEIKKRGFSQNDIDSLRTDEFGNLLIPMFFNHVSNSFESVFTSILSKVVRQKVHGQSYVQASASGITTIGEYGDSSDIVMIDPTRKDRTPRFITNKNGEVEAAEVYVPWRFLKDGKEIDIKGYIDKDGYLDTNKIDPKLLRLITARIPNQGFSSMLPVKVIGFLPSNRNTVIVPLEIVGQMGSDFDVDKLYGYMWNYKIYRNGNIRLYDNTASIRYTIRTKIENENNKELKELKIRRNKLLQDYLKENPGNDETLLSLINEIEVSEKRYDEARRTDISKLSQEDIEEIRALVKEEEAYIKEARKKLNDYLRTAINGLKGQDINTEITEVNNLITAKENEINSLIQEAYKSEGVAADEQDLSKLDLKTLQNLYFDLHWEVLTHEKAYDLITTPLDSPDLKDEYNRLNTKDENINDELSLVDPTFNANAYFENRAGKEGVAIESNFLVFNAMIQSKKPFKIVAEGKELVFNIGGLKLSKLALDSSSVYIGADGKPRNRRISDNIQVGQNEAVDNAKNGRLGALNLNAYTFNAANALLMLSDDTDPNNPKSVSNDYVVALLTHPSVLRYIERREFDFNQFSDKYSRSKDNRLRLKLLSDKQSFNFKLPSLKDLREGKGNSIEILNTFFALDEIGQYLSDTQRAVNISTKGIGKSFIESQLKSIEYADKIEGDGSPSLMYGITIKGMHNLMDTDYGYASGHILSVLNDIGNEFYPYREMLRTLHDYFRSQNIFVSDKDWRKIFNHYKAFIFSHPSFYNTDVNSERERLLYSEDNIIDRFVTLSNYNRKGVGDYFFNEIFVDRENNILKYPAAKQDRLDAHKGTNALLQLLNSSDPELSRFGRDFITYSLLVSPIQGANNFMKFMPNSVWYSFSKVLRQEEANLKSGNIEYDKFLQQLIQNEPDFAPTTYVKAFSYNNTVEVPSLSEINNTLQELEKLEQTDKIDARIKQLNSLKSLYVKGENVKNPELNEGDFTILQYVKTSGENPRVFKVTPVDDGFLYERVNVVSSRQSYIYDYKGTGEDLKPITVNKSDTTNMLKTLRENYGITSRIPNEPNSNTVIEGIMESSEATPYHKVVAQIYRSSGKTSKVHVDLEQNVPGTEENGLIKINLILRGSSYDISKEQDIIRTIVHEMNHAILNDAIDNPKTPEQEKLVKNLKGLREQAIILMTPAEMAEYKAFAEKYKDPKRHNEITEYEKAKYYGFANVKEFVAQAWSEPEFQRFLNSKKSGNKTLLEKVYALLEDLLVSIAESFGFVVDKNSILADTLDNSLRLMLEGEIDNITIGSNQPVTPVSSNTNTPVFDSLPSPTGKTMTYAGIGSRQTPQDILNKMTEIARDLESKGYTLRSGAADGADKAFEKGVKSKKEIFEGMKPTGQKEKQVAHEIHPNLQEVMDASKNKANREGRNGDRSSWAVENLMARNTNQIFGANLDTPVDFVLAYDPSGWEGIGNRPSKGGTLQAIDMAARKSIPVINMAVKGWEQKLQEVLSNTSTQQTSTSSVKGKDSFDNNVTPIEDMFVNGLDIFKNNLKNESIKIC